ncbi:MAG: hypothetical protein ABIG96_06610 [Candidatus Micrarchaeota archaeon]
MPETPERRALLAEIARIRSTVYGPKHPDYPHWKGIEEFTAAQFHITSPIQLHNALNERATNIIRAHMPDSIFIRDEVKPLKISVAAQSERKKFLEWAERVKKEFGIQ